MYLLRTSAHLKNLLGITYTYKSPLEYSMYCDVVGFCSRKHGVAMFRHSWSRATNY